MADMTREKIKTYYENMATNQDPAWKAMALYILDILRKLEAYENADLIERDKAISEIKDMMPYQDTEYDGAIMDAVVVINDIPRFEPTKGSDE